MRHFLRAVTLLVGLTFAGSAAQAADVYNGSMKDDAPVVDTTRVFSAVATPWKGFYVGLYGGYVTGAFDAKLDSWERSKKGIGSFETFTDGFDGPNPWLNNPADLDFDSGIFGAHVGYDHQVANIVFGVVADIGWLNGDSSISDTKTCGPDGDDKCASVGGLVHQEVNLTTEYNLDQLVTLRARAGTLLNDKLLVYVTGGLAFGWVDASIHRTFDKYVDKDKDNHISGSLTATDDNVHMGYTIGGGLEYQVSDHVFVGAEYLYVDLGDEDYSLTGTCTGGNDHVIKGTTDLDVHVFKVTGTYKLN